MTMRIAISIGDVVIVVVAALVGVVVYMRRSWAWAHAGVNRLAQKESEARRETERSDRAQAVGGVGGWGFMPDVCESESDQPRGRDEAGYVVVLKVRHEGDVIWMYFFGFLFSRSAVGCSHGGQRRSSVRVRARMRRVHSSMAG